MQRASVLRAAQDVYESDRDYATGGAYAFAEFGQILAKPAQHASSHSALLFGPLQAAGQHVKLLVALQELDLDLGMIAHLRPILFHELFLEVGQLSLGCRDEIKRSPFAEQSQVLLADNAAIKNPDPTQCAVLAFY